MLRRWLERWRGARQARSAGDLQAWLDSSRALLDLCHDPLRALEGPSDIGAILDRIDRRLMRFRNEAAFARSALLRQPPLAGAVRQATNDLFVLRNETCAFLLRWQTLQQLPGSHLASIEAQRRMEGERLQASRTARLLIDELEALAPEVERLISVGSHAADGPD